MRSDGIGRGDVFALLAASQPGHERARTGRRGENQRPGHRQPDLRDPFSFFPFSIVAVVFGHVSLSQIKESAGRLGGQGLAIAGLVLGYLGIAMIPLVLIIAAIAIPNLLRARMAANESSAAYSLRTINTAQVTYQATFEELRYAPDLQSVGGSLPCSSTPATACLIDNRLAVARQLARQERVHSRRDAF
jgi:hypothetical protein